MNEEPNISIPYDGCWKKIGVQGDQSCKELARYIHCRNCPVFSDAAEMLLDMSAEYSATETGACYNLESKDNTNSSSNQISLLIFRICNEWFGIQTESLREVMNLCPIHSIQHHHCSFVEGIANIRGELVIVIALDRLFSVETTIKNEENISNIEKNRIIVVNSPRGPIAFCVDNISKICSYDADAIKPVPDTVKIDQLNYTLGIIKESEYSVTCLNVDVFLNSINNSFG